MKKTSFMVILLLTICLLSSAFAVTTTKATKKSLNKKTSSKTVIMNIAPVPSIIPNANKTIPSQLKEPARNIPSASGWFINFGSLGSAGTIAGGYEKAINDRASLLLDTGYGIGNNYMLALVKGTFIFKFKNDPDQLNPFIGLEVNYSDYSKKVIDVPGVNSIEKDYAGGGGILLGLSKNNLSFTIGYDSRSGYLAGIGCKIGR